MRAGYEILEHTADVGVRSWGDSMAEAFEQCGWGLADVLGARRAGPGRTRTIRASGSDREALLVDFLNELILVHEADEAGFARISVRRLSLVDLEAEIELVPLDGEPEGVGVKAATYHQLRLDERPDGGAEAQVYLDV